MKRGIVETIIGVVGIVQYAYYQLFSSLSLKFEVEQDPPMIIYSRDWTVGVIGAIIGLIFLVVGLCRIREARATKEVACDVSGTGLQNIH